MPLESSRHKVSATGSLSKFMERERTFHHHGHRPRRNVSFALGVRSNGWKRIEKLVTSSDNADDIKAIPITLL